MMKNLGKKKKVAIVYHFFAHYRGPLIQEMLNSEINDYYFVAGENTSSSFKNLKLHEFQNESRFKKVKNIWILRNFLWQSNLIKVLRSERFDSVVFLGDWKFLSTWVAIFILKIYKIPTFFWSHGVRSENQSLNNKLKMIFLKSFSHGGFVYDQLASKIMRSLGFKKPISVIYNSLNYRLQEEIISNFDRTQLLSPFAKGVNYVIFTGRIEKRKKLDMLINATAILKAKNLFVGVLIIGDGEVKSNLMEQTRTLAVDDRVNFLASCYDEKFLANYFINSMACIIPDAVGLTAIHALTYGTPIITNDSMILHGPEIECVQEGVSGFFYKNDDPSSLAERIQYLINLTQEERDKIGENGRRIIASHYNPDKQLVVMNELISTEL